MPVLLASPKSLVKSSAPDSEKVETVVSNILTVIDNAADDNSLFEQLDAWLSRHGFGDVVDKEEADA